MFPAQVRNESDRLKALKFGRLAVCLALGKTNTQLRVLARASAEEVQRVLASPDGVDTINALLRKSAVDPMGTGNENTDSPYEPALSAFKPLSVGFNATLAAFGAVDAAMADAQRAQANAVFGILAAATGAVGEHAEGNWKRVGQHTFTPGTIQGTTVNGCIVATAETLRFSTSASLITEALQQATAGATDASGIGQITSGLTPIVTAGGDAFGVLADLAAMMADIGLSKSSKPHLIVSPETARRLSVLPNAVGALAFPDVTFAGGEIVGVPLHTSDSAGDSIILVDASGFAWDPGLSLIEIVRHANMVLDSDKAAGTAKQTINLFQTGSIAIRAERQFALAPLRKAAAVIENASWGVIDSPSSP